MSVLRQEPIEWVEALPADWRVKRLGSFATVKARLGWKGLKAEEYVEQGYIFLATPNLKGDEIDFENVNFITQARYDESPEIMLKEGDVLVAKDGATLGITAQVKQLPAPATVNGSLAVIRSNGECESRFLYHWLRSRGVQQLIDKMKGGMGVPHLFQSDLRRFPVALPAPADQRRIAGYLDDQTAKIDRLMGLRRRQMALLKEQRAAIIQQAVTRGLNPDAPLRDSGLPWLGQIPRQWGNVNLGRLATMLQTGPFGSQLHADEYVEGGIPLINPSHMAEGRIQCDPECTVDATTAERLDRHVLRAGDIVFARRGELGRCALVGANEVGWLCGTGSLLMRPDTRVLEPAYLVLLFQTKRLKESLTLQSVGSTMDNLNTGILSRTGLPCPPLDEQRDVVRFIEAGSAKFAALHSAYSHQLELLAEYRAALIHECVTGQRTVPEQETHP